MWRDWDWLTVLLTLLVFWLECLAPLLALLPSYRLRLVGLGALLVLEVTIWLNLEAGLFPLISIISLVPLLPTRLVADVVRWRSRRRRADPFRPVLFYDRDCRFCLFACRLLLAVGDIRCAELRTAQSDPVAARILAHGFSWSASAPDETDPARYRQG